MLAAAPITWGVCELADWGEVPPYAQVLDEMAAAGVEGTELGPDGYLPADPKALWQELSQRRLKLAGAFCPVAFHSPAQSAASVAVAVALARRLAAVECSLLIAADAGDQQRRAIAGRVESAQAAGDGTDLTPDQWARFADGMVELARRCAALGMRVAFHPHAGTYVETRAELGTLLARTPPDLVGLCLDTGHLVFGGADPVEVWRTFAGRVWHLHVKDVRPHVLARVREEQCDYPTAVGLGVFAPLGEGMVDFVALIDALRGAGYGGWYVLEQDVRLGPPWPTQDPAANVLRSVAYLRRQLTSPSRHLSQWECMDERGALVEDQVRGLPAGEAGGEVKEVRP